MTNDYDYEGAPCATCGELVHPLAVFPGGLCLACYAQTEEANAPITAEQLAEMWGKS